MAEWPKAGKVHTNILEYMSMTREGVSKGLEAGQKAGIPVRQPLASLKLKVPSEKLKDEYLELIKEELNVKEIILGKEFLLDTNITPELKEEGNYRELVRAIQDMRKKQGLTPSEKIILTLGSEHKDLSQKFESELKKAVFASEIILEEGAQIKISKAHLNSL